MTPNGAVGRPRRAVAAAAVLATLIVGGFLAGGCTAGRSELGTGSSPCYEALPEAVAAVHGAGSLKGVRLVSVSSLHRFQTRLYDVARAASGPRVSHVCLVAFSGHFSAPRVEKPVGRYRGTLAVVELAYPSHRLLATLLVARPPLPFGHTHIG
jgi:hypothetical protein